MTRISCIVAYWIACGFSAACFANPPPASEAEGALSLPVRGEMVDTETPATYRLPMVGAGAAAEARLAMRTDAAAHPMTPNRLAGKLAAGKSTQQTSAALAFPPTATELTSQLLPAVQRGYNLAQHGAFYAARTEFIQVLRRVAQAKDAGADCDDHSRALAAGLRALDEADDFVPQGVQLEAELDVCAVASSHRTPVLRDCPEDVMPQEAVTLYHSYAEERLAHSAAGEQAGSMALYGLGKVYSRLAERRDDDVQFTRSAMTMYSAALEACPNNHLAANELGVLLCRTGHALEAVQQFKRTIDLAPNATAYHNLAIAQQKLGMSGQAAANEQESQRLAAIERSTGTISRRAGVQWVSPADMARVTQPASPAPAIAAPTTAAKPATPSRSSWR